MTNRNIEEAIINSLRKLGCDVEELLPVHELHGDLGIDSTEMVELATLICTECGLKAKHIDLHVVKTIGDLVGHVELLLK